MTFRLIATQLRPKLTTLLQKRNIRPSIKVAKDKFQLDLDVRSFSRDEIRVKARPEYVIIEGKQEKKTKSGYIMRQFVRKFKLPEGCCLETMESKLSKEGVLTVSASRKHIDPGLPCETLIPITDGSSKKDEDTSFVPVQDPCAAYTKATQKVCPPANPANPPKEKKP